MKKIIVLTLIVLFYGCAKNPSLTTQKLLKAQQLNVLEQPIIYPTQQPAEVTSVFGHYGDLCSLACSHHVWVSNSKLNTPQIESFWKLNKGY